MYNEFGNFLFEGHLKHTCSEINALKDMIDYLKVEHEQVPKIAFEATGVYSKMIHLNIL